MEFFSEWDNWKKTLGKAVNVGNKMGIDDENIVNIGSQIGDFLDKRLEPENREQRVIKELWDVASEDEQRSLTNMLVKMVKAEEQVDKSR